LMFSIEWLEKKTTPSRRGPRSGFGKMKNSACCLWFGGQLIEYFTVGNQLKSVFCFFKNNFFFSCIFVYFYLFCYFPFLNKEMKKHVFFKNYKFIQINANSATSSW